MTELQNAYYDLIVGREGDKEAFWVKRLRNILESDIHKSPLGCKIPDTHIKIGDVHLHSFYEAQILFSHPHWVKRFASWLNNQLHSLIDNDNSIHKLNIIGYETYLEPVLYHLKSINKAVEIEYGIYEEPKYLQSVAKKPSEERIRYIEYLDSKAPCIYVCGISSTLSTFNKMINKHNNIDGPCYSLIQVFPDNKSVDEDNDIDKIVKQSPTQPNKAVSMVNNNREAVFLVSVKCEWEQATKCQMCFPNNPLDEKPIIQTSETSVVPIQMIQPINTTQKNYGKEYSTIDFFSKNSDGDYIFKDYLYYGHIDRMDHHYKYYIRTGRLVKDILDCNNEKYSVVRQQFKDYCEYIYEMEVANEDSNTINIIVSPAHFSDEIFPNAINELVFKGKAHTISFDLNKEYRSSFLTKYSNIAYFIEQAQDRHCKVRFYYIDDQLISIETYSRAKSLIRSLMNNNTSGESRKRKENEKRIELEIFPAVIVFLSRNSRESKLDYVETKDRYYSFIDINVPSIRNFADSCPVCKLRQDAEDYSKKSILSVNAEHWAEKHDYYDAVSVPDARKRKKKASEKNPSFSDRYMRRFECEDELWSGIDSNCNNSTSYDEVIRSVITKHSKGKNRIITRKGDEDRRISARDIDVEYIISIIKAISMPFLYYRECEKKAALRFVLEIISQFEKGNIIGKELLLESRSIRILFENEQQKYELLIVLVNCLAAMDSTYLLSWDRIKALCDTVESIDNRLLSVKYKKGDSYKEGFFSSVLFAFKRSICGIGGKAKISVFDERITQQLDDHEEKYEDLIRFLFLENTDENCNFDSIKDESKPNANPTGLLSRYEAMYRVLKERFANYKRDSKKIPSKTDLLDTYFVYVNKRSGMPYRFTNSDYSRLYSDDDLLSDIASLSNTETAGILFKANRCIVRLNLINKNDFNNDESEVLALSNKISDSSDMYFIMIFNDDSQQALWGIREILKYRHSICRELRNDLLTGNIKASIQAKKGGELLTSNKSISHNIDRDIKSLSEQAIYLINNFDKDDDASFIYACSAVGTYMNRCIGYTYTNKTVKTYFSDSDDSKNQNRTNEQRFVNSLQEAINWEKGLSFLEYYFTDLIRGKESKYLKYRDDGYSGRIDFTIIGENPIDVIKQMKMAPHFVTPGTHHTKYALLSFIGIFDTLLMNAISHSPSRVSCVTDDDWYFGNKTDQNIVFKEEEKVHIKCVVNKFSSEDNEAYEIGLINNTNERFTKNGITVDFFNEISETKTRHFCISTENTGLGEFESKISVSIK